MHFQYQRLLTPALSNSTASQSSGWTVNTNREAEASCLMGLWEGARADNCWVMSDRKQTFAPIAAWHNEVCSVLIRCQDEFLSILKFWGSADGEAWIFEQSLFCLQLFPVTFELEVQSVFKFAYMGKFRWPYRFVPYLLLLLLLPTYFRPNQFYRMDSTSSSTSTRLDKQSRLSTVEA